MIDFDVTGDAADGLEEVSDGLDDFDQQYGRNSMGNAVADGISETVQETVLPLARQLGSKHVGEHAGKIKASDGNWERRTYQAGLRANDPIVESHEYGSGIHGPANRAYRIDPGPNTEKLVFDSGGETVGVDYVIHPGVEGKGFMAKAGAQGLDDAVESIGDEIDANLSEAVR